MRIAFSKYEGLGNDFVLVEAALAGGVGLAGLGAEQAQRICDRHRGVGADGVLCISMSASSPAPALRGGALSAGHPSMHVINADGSVPEMCGNGIRCVALHLARIGRVGDLPFEIDTDSGPHRCKVLEIGRSGLVEVAMRPASLVPADVPVRAPAALRDEPLELGGRTLRWTAVGMGNPHAVTFDELGQQPGPARTALAPLVQAAAMFPNGVNVGFAQMRGPRALEVAVFERGVGWTEACGTGACAAAVAAVETGRAARGEALSVQLPGGTLTIVVPAAGERISMTGPARHVFDGVLEIW